MTQAHFAADSTHHRVFVPNPDDNTVTVIDGAHNQVIATTAVGNMPEGVDGALATPSLTLFDQPGTVIATDTGWSNAPASGPSTVPATLQPATSATMKSVGAFALTANSPDCAMVVTLPSGLYTAQVSGVSGATGIALAEVYEVPPPN